MVDLGLKTLLYDKVRFLITVSGVAFAVTLVLVQVGLFVGLLDNSTITIRKLDADLWITSKNSPNLDFVHQFPESNLYRARAVPGVARADNLILSFMQVSLPTGAEETTIVYAMEDFRRWGIPWQITAGNVDDLKRGSFVMFDESASKRFGAFAVGDYREVNGQRLKIIGTSREAKSFTTTPLAFMDFRRAQELQPELLGGKTSYIVVKLAPGANAETVRAELARRLPYNDVFTSAAWAERSRGYWVENTGIGFNAFLTVFLGCLVGVVVVAQTLYTSTMEHLKEFGTVKAIGGSNLDIYRMLGKQASVAAVLGFVLGYVPAQLLKPVIASAGLKLIIAPEVTAVVLVGTLLLCTVSALVSFRKVASIDPALVFRT
ncbi:MAG TPA: ABC transporter permease [Polyangiaceae bacterium]|nr:ABC transporter permease [Polyangiaceae bacterium]